MKIPSITTPEIVVSDGTAISVGVFLYLVAGFFVGKITIKLSPDLDPVGLAACTFLWPLAMLIFLIGFISSMLYLVITGNHYDWEKPMS